eukprot:gene41673-56441_t
MLVLVSVVNVAVVLNYNSAGDSADSGSDVEMTAPKQGTGDL